ncbi:ABC transporter permease [Aquimarina sp. 433]
MNRENIYSKAGVLWLFKMAWRDGRASISRLLLFMASIILGIAAVVSIQLFSTNLKQNIQGQSKSLLGADYIIDSRQQPNEKVKAIIDSLVPDAYEVNFPSMAAFPKNGAAKLVRVRGMEGSFPFYGDLETTPENAASTYQQKGGALVDATVLLQYDLKAGDSIKLGVVTFPIIGAINSMPGSSGIGTSVAPTVLIPYRFVEKTELLQVGSRKEYQYFFVDPDKDLDELEKVLDPILDDENADLDTHTSSSRQIGRSYDNLGRFLNLAAFIALLLGCIGIASSVHIYIKEKLTDVAVLKCIGASRKQSFLIYLIQIAVMGLIGGLVGTIIGIGLQYALPALLQEFLPFDIEITTAPQPIIMGLLLGMFMSVLFALLPLLGTWFVSPLEVLRVSEKPAVKSRKTRIFAFGAIIIFVLLFGIWIFGDLKFASAFVMGVFVTFAILAGISVLFIKAIKRYFPSSWGFTARTSLLNLFRPNNQTMVLILAIGLGTFLISTLYFTKDILLAKTQLDNSSDQANLILVDIQPEQHEAAINTLKDNNSEVLNNLSIVTMRMQKIKGIATNDIRKDTTSTIREWVLNHEFRTTFRDSLIASETVVEGEWIKEIESGEDVMISISEGLAKDAQIGLGDKVVFNIQGVLMETIVGSIRKVDWTRLQLNFMVVFPKGVLEQAPQFHVLTTYVPDTNKSASLQQQLVSKFPNVTVFDLRQIYTVIEDILQKISWVINFMAFFSILTGLIVLIGSVRTSKYQRIKESVLLRTLGAKSKQILRITALEYLYLGILGSLAGILLSLISSQLLATLLFEEPFVPSGIPFMVFLPAIVLVVLAIGLSNIRSVLQSPPLAVLRKVG